MMSFRALFVLLLLAGCQHSGGSPIPCGDAGCAATQVCVHLCCAPDAGACPPPVCGTLGSMYGAKLRSA